MAFRTMDEVIAAAEQRDNPELFFRNGLAGGVWGDERSKALVSEWIRRAEQARSETAEAAAIGAADRSATAAEQSALWAKVAAVVSALALVIAAVALFVK